MRKFAIQIEKPTTNGLTSLKPPVDDRGEELFFPKNHDTKFLLNLQQNGVARHFTKNFTVKDPSSPILLKVREPKDENFPDPVG